MMKWKLFVVVATSAIALTASYAASASATSIEVGGVKTESATLRFSLTKGTTLTTARTDGSLANTCLEWDIEGTGFNIGSLIFWFKINTHDYTKCTEAITVDKNGELGIEYSSGTNGTVSMKESEVTVRTPFGTPVNCKTGAGTDLGALTGVSSGSATLHVNAVLNCGFLLPSATMKASLTATTPSGLGVLP